uniref:Uncharacterized protein n=1 Tax=Leptospira santarosai serovar Arenal str. MAVJ 401 TaxID=1049976 RepID=M6JGK7_9LEPT|nr:hypothetical protein LEP1GSC063_2375 [Leptospira santarosai serovar Arenal str. MAVJ 401]
MKKRDEIGPFIPKKRSVFAPDGTFGKICSNHFDRKKNETFGSKRREFDVKNFLNRRSYVKTNCGSSYKLCLFMPNLHLFI